MSSGKTILGLSDLPFAYSAVNILYFTTYGIENFVIVFPLIGIFAGMLGTFLVLIHPMQRFIEKTFIDRQLEKSKIYKLFLNELPRYGYTNWKLDTSHIGPALRSESIKYEKDRIAGTLYFLLSLIIFIFFISNPNGLEIIGSVGSIISLILAIVLIMFVTTFVITIKEMKQFSRRVQLNAIYYALLENFSGNSQYQTRLDRINRALDNNDWTTSKQTIDEFMHSLLKVYRNSYSQTKENLLSEFDLLEIAKKINKY